MTTVANRRQFWRAAFPSPVRLIGSGGTVTAELLDISARGALVEVPPEWTGHLGDSCHLKLRLSDAHVIVMAAEVAHVEGRQVGLRCQRIDVASIGHLRRLVQLNAGDPEMLERELDVLLAG